MNTDKTAMQELIEYLDKYNEVFGMIGLSIRDRASILLEKEQEQIKNGYKAAITINLSKESQEDEAYDYFTQTFK